MDEYYEKGIKHRSCGRLALLMLHLESFIPFDPRDAWIQCFAVTDASYCFPNWMLSHSLGREERKLRHGKE